MATKPNNGSITAFESLLLNNRNIAENPQLAARLTAYTAAVLGGYVPSATILGAIAALTPSNAAAVAALAVLTTQLHDSGLIDAAPVNTVIGPRTVAEDSDLFITGLSINDMDAGGAMMTTTLSVAHGSLTVLAVDGGAAIIGSETTTVTLTGTLSQINITLAALNAVVYRGEADYNGPDTLTMTTNDGFAGLGGARIDIDTVTINVTAVNDAAIITGTSSSNLIESDVAQSTGGTLLASDIDSSSAFVAQTDVAGSNGHGKFSISVSGSWTYTMNSAHDEFTKGQIYTDSITVTTADGTPQMLTVTITGSNDAALLSSDVLNLVETDTALSTSGTLAISDVDSAASFVAQAGAIGAYGTFAIDASGAWTYNASSAHDEFMAGTTYTDTFTVASVDGATTSVTINITGTEDNRAPVAVNDIIGGAATLSGQVFYGGANDQRFTEVAYGLGRLYVSGTVTSGATSQEAIATAYDVGTLATQWSRLYPGDAGSSPNYEYFSGVAVDSGASDAVFVGSFFTQAVDNTGGKEVKADIVNINPDTGTIDWARQATVSSSTAMYSYSGTEVFEGIASTVEAGNTYYYAVGGGEPFSYMAMAAVKYDVNGVRVAQAADPALGGSFSPYNPGTIGGSIAHDVTVAGGQVYVAGFSAWTFQGDSDLRPDLWTFNASLGLQNNFKDTALFGEFNAVASDGSNVYAVGYRKGGVSGTDDYLVEKFDSAGNFVWRSAFGTTGSDRLNDAVVVGGRLFVVGYSNSETGGAGGDDAVLMEIDSATGATISRTLFGGAGIDRANGITTDGSLLYVVGETRSFATGDNSAGQNDGFLLQYSLGSGNEDSVQNIAASSLLTNDADADGDSLSVESVSAISALGASVVLSGGTIVYNPGTSTRLQALQQGQTATDSFNYVISDGHGGTSTATVSLMIGGRNDAPVLTSGALASFAENATGTVYTATAGDADDSTVLSYALGGVDAAHFNINAATGEVSFKAPPDFEDPTDFGGNNVYDITVSANDGTRSSAARAVAITVTNINEVPIVPVVITAAMAATPDIVAVNLSSGTVGVLSGDGAGGFAPATSFASGGASPYAVVLGDMNGDGMLDIVTANNITSDTVGVLLGNGAGGFAPATTFASGGDDPNWLALGDVNGDGKLDVVAGHALSSNVGVLIGNGTGGFAPAASFASGGAFVLGVALGDMNGDGKLDIVAANLQSNSVGVLSGDGLGGFGPAHAFSTGGSPTTVVLGDVNGDGRLDILTANYYGNAIGVLINNGSGFSAPTSYSSGGSNPRAMALGDVNGDGNLDIVTANESSGNIGVLLGNGHGSFGAATLYATGGNVSSVALADLNADGRLDIVAANYGTNSIDLLTGNGSGGFALTGILPSGGSFPYFVAVGDVGDTARNLLGNAGNDILTGGNAADTLTGNGGNDVLTGGLGSDQFDYNSASDGTDTITDFARGPNGDVLDLRDVLSSFSGYDGTNALTGGFLRFAAAGADTLVQVDSTGGGDSFTSLAVLTNTLLLAADTGNYLV